MLSSDNNSIFEFSALTDISAEVGVRLGNPIFANHERARLKMKKQEDQISQKYDFFDDNDDDKKDFPNDIPVKIEVDFPDDNYDDVVIKQIKKTDKAEVTIKQT